MISQQNTTTKSEIIQNGGNEGGKQISAMDVSSPYRNTYKKSIALLFLFVSGIFCGLYIAEYQYRKNLPAKHIPTVFETLMSSDKIQESYDILSHNYYKFEEHPKIDLQNGIIKGMIGSLGDKHSEFFTMDESKAFHETLAGDFQGIGAVIGDDKRGVIIEKIIPDSPAEKSKLEIGNIIVEVSGESIAGLEVKDAVKKIRGPKGTIVKLKLFNPISTSFQTVDVTRDSIVIPSVVTKVLSGSLGYIEVSLFGEKTGGDFSKALETLTATGVKGIIVDLRYNGGGYLDEAAKMLSNFIEKDKPLVTTKGSLKANTYTLFSDGGRYLDIPLIFLVNDMSASASEIMVGAIQDYARGVIVGEKTYGKGSVQQPFILSDGTEMKITIAKWYTPKDRGIDGTGLKPDIQVTIKDEDYKNKYDRQLETAKDILKTLVETQSVATTIHKYNP